MYELLGSVQISIEGEVQKVVFKLILDPG